MKEKRYKEYYNLLGKKFRAIVKKKKEKLAESGIRFMYKDCFQKLQEYLDKRGKTATELAREKTIYKEKLIKNFVRAYIKELQEKR